MADGDAPLAKRPPLTMILKLVATVVILALVVYSLDLEKLSGALSAIDWHWLLLGSLASALFVSLRIIKWRELTRRNGMNASGKDIARTALLGLAVGLITPVRLGELVGVAPFPRSDRGKAILSHGYDRLYELFGAGLQPSGGVPAPWLDRPPSERRHRRALRAWHCRGAVGLLAAKIRRVLAVRQSAEAQSSARRHYRHLAGLLDAVHHLLPHRLPPADVLHRRHRADP